jgi:pimeloyl-ACP methyl ester carboxylesterase
MLHYTSNGVGQTIVLIHGFCENSTCFNEQVFLLNPYFNILTIDLPGHGKSAVLPSFTMDTLADELKNVLDTAAVSSCVMIGHSMGGYATLAFAKKYPTLLKGFGLMHSTANADSAERKTKREQAIAVVNEKGAELYVRNFIPPLFSSGTAKEIIETRQVANNTITPESIIAGLTAMKNRDDSNAFISETNLPVAFFVGKQDALIPETDMLLQAANAKISQVVYLEHSAHMGMFEQPQKVSDGLKLFAEFCFEK